MKYSVMLYYSFKFTKYFAEEDLRRISISDKGTDIVISIMHEFKSSLSIKNKIKYWKHINKINRKNRFGK